MMQKACLRTALSQSDLPITFSPPESTFDYRTGGHKHFDSSHHPNDDSVMKLGTLRASRSYR